MPKKRKPRNFHACHPIMRKGGIHEKSQGAKRAAAKQETQRNLRDSLAASQSFYGLFQKEQLQPTGKMVLCFTNSRLNLATP